MLLCLCIAACASGDSHSLARNAALQRSAGPKAAPAGEAGSSTPAPAGSTPAPAGITLTAPSELAQQIALDNHTARRASYVGADLFRFATDFDAALPHRLVSTSEQGLSFTPDFDGEAPAAEGLSYAIYNFSIPDYDGPPLLRYEWVTEPETPGDVWFALANWDANRWDFYRGSALGQNSLQDMDQYFIFGGTLLAAVIAGGSAAVDLSTLHIGSPPPTASVSANTPAGVVPFSIDFNASFSLDPDGEIVDYSWDPEGDGSFVSTGLDPHFSFNFVEAGDYPMTLRVTDDSGLHDESSADIAALDHVSLSYGAPNKSESAARVLVNPEGQLVLAGTRDSGGFLDTFVANVPPARFFTRFANSWGGLEDESLSDAVLGADGDIYTCGWSESFGNPGRDGLLQKWNSSGELVWARCIELAPNQLELNALILHGQSIYACGSFTSDTPIRFGLVLKYDLEGNLVWLHTLLAGGSCEYRDLVFHDTVAIGTPLLKLCGSYAAGAADDTDMAYAEYDASGALVAFTVGQNEGEDCANGICLDGSALPRTFICGELEEVNRSAFFGEPGDVMALFRDSSGFDLIGQDVDAPNFIMRHFASEETEDFIVATVSETLGFEFRRIGSPSQSIYRAASVGRSSGHCIVGGLQTEELPLNQSAQPEQLSVGLVWTDLTPSQGTPPVLQLAAPTETFALNDMGFNREAGDGDCFVYIDDFQQGS